MGKLYRGEGNQIKLKGVAMVKIQEHLKKMEEIRMHINNSKGNQRKQFIKCLHRLQKELRQCELYLNAK
jgi:hypothetical protein